MTFLFDHLQYLLLMGVLLFLSAFFSASETALFSLKAIDLNTIRKRRDAADRALLALHHELPDFLSTVLFCNMTVNVAFFAVSTLLATRVAITFGNSAGVGFSFATLVMLIALSEATPKSLAAALRVPVARLAAVPMYLLHRILFPVRTILGRMGRMAERLAGAKPPSAAFKVEELRLLLELSREGGILSEQEHAFLSEVLDLSSVRIGEVMTPRVDVVAIDREADCAALLALARSSGHSKLLVRDPATEDFMGWIDARDVFVKEGKGSLLPFIRRSLYFSTFDRVDQALQRFLQSEDPLAIAVDERGATAGIVTITDVVGKIFGRIGDEDAPPSEPIREEGNAYILDGRLSVREWRNLFGVATELPRTATIGGLFVAFLERAPRVGDRIRIGNMTLEAVDVQRRRVRKIRLTLG